MKFQYSQKLLDNYPTDWETSFPLKKIHFHKMYSPGRLGGGAEAPGESPPGRVEYGEIVAVSWRLIV